jgi:hypothetical protein
LDLEVGKGPESRVRKREKLARRIKMVLPGQDDPSALVAAFI